MTVVPSLGQGEQYTCSKHIPSQDICHDTHQFNQHKLKQLCDWVHPDENVDKASGCQIQMSFFHVPLVAAVPLVYSIVLNSATGYYLMAWVNNRTSPFFVTMFYPVQMIVSALLDWMFYSHKVCTKCACLRLCMHRVRLSDWQIVGTRFHSHTHPFPPPLLLSLLRLFSLTVCRRVLA